MKNVELVMMSYDQSSKEALEWAKKESFPWPTVLDKDKGAVHFGSVEVRGIPTYILFDKGGKEIAKGKEVIFKKLRRLKKLKR